MRVTRGLGVYENCRKKYEVCCLLAVAEELLVLNVVVLYRNDVLLLKKMAELRTKCAPFCIQFIGLNTTDQISYR